MLDACFRRKYVRFYFQVGTHRRNIIVLDACKGRNLVLTCFPVEAFHISPLAFRERGVDIDLIKTVLSDDVPGQRPQFGIRTDGGRYANAPVLCQELADLGDTTDVLRPVFPGKTEICVEPFPQLITVEYDAEDPFT